MSEKYLVGYDGSPASRRAVNFAAERAKAGNAPLLIAYVLEWSPYTFLTPDELEERHRRRGEELDRAKTAITDPVVAELKEHGVDADSVIKYGHVAETLCSLAEEVGASQLFIGRTGDSSVVARVFGSVAGSLAQIAPVPCTLIP